MKVPVLILGLLLPWFALAQEQYYGTRASSFTLSGTESQTDIQSLPLHVGDTITPENVRDAIQALYDTKHYSYIEVDAQRAADGGTALTFRVKVNYFFSTFRLDPENLLDRPLSGYFRLPLGERFTKSAADRVIQDARDLLKSDGYFQATIAPTYDFDQQTRLVFVTLKTTPGQKAKVGTVSLQGGEQTFSNKELLDAFGLKAGDDFNSTKLEKGVFDIRAKFTNLSFLNTRVNADRDYVPASNTVDIKITVQPGQFVLVQPRGADVPKKRLRELVPVYEEGMVDMDLVEEGRIAIQRYIQQQGYFDATVSSELIEVDPTLANAIQINYSIMPGVRHEIAAVKLSGNQYFTDDEIRRRIKTRPSGVLDRGLFGEEILNEDRRSIEAMYRNAGYENTVITTMAQDVDHTIVVTIDIQEGKLFPIDFITITGNSAFTEQQLREASKLKEGDIYTPSKVDQGRAALTQFYYSQGYADARVERTVDRVETNNGVRVTFQITEGKPLMIGSILIAGNTITKDKVIRQNSRLQPYRPYDPEAVLEAQQRLYSTGLFSRVEIVTLDQGIPGVRNLLIQVEDAKPILLTYGLGFQEFEKARGTFEVSHNNLFGLNRSISLRTRGSVRERLAQSTYREPRLFNHDLDGFVSGFIEHTERPSFTANRIDFSVQTLKRISLQQNLLFSAGYQTVNLQDIRVNIHANSVPQREGLCQVCQIARLAASFVQDRRDDPLNPSTGTFTTTTFQVASQAFGSELNFTSLFNQYAFYTPLRWGVLATSTRLGWNHPYGSTVKSGLPPTEQYFAGGSTTLRGYGFDKAEPNGGNVMTIANVEYRVPLRRLPIRNVTGAIFYDTGNVFQEVANVHLANFTHTAGFGFRYQTPLGPVRFDIGVNLNPTVNGLNEKRFHFFFTLGNPF